MNKREVEKMLPTALTGLKDSQCEIVEGGKIDKNFRGQIAAFGAAVTMGSFKSAVAFFGAKGGSDVERQNLVRLMYYIVKNEWKAANEIVDEILAERDSAKLRAMQEKYLNASLAIKLALNAFHLE